MARCWRSALVERERLAALSLRALHLLLHFKIIDKVNLHDFLVGQLILRALQFLLQIVQHGRQLVLIRVVILPNFTIRLLDGHELLEAVAVLLLELLFLQQQLIEHQLFRLQLLLLLVHLFFQLFNFFYFGESSLPLLVVHVLQLSLVVMPLFIKRLQ